MRINIILPFYPSRPIGGFKVHYEYANRLAARGHQVTVVHPRSISPLTGLRERMTNWVWPFLKPVISDDLSRWFAFNPSVTLLQVPDLREKFIPDAGATVATCWSTVEGVRNYSARKGKKFYVVYDYEVWKSAPENVRARMRETFHAGLVTVATSPAVNEMLGEAGAKSDAYIPCGVDLADYNIDIPIRQRPSGEIGFPARRDESKGLADAIRASEMLRERWGDRIRVSAFGPIGDDRLPGWISFNEFPSNAQLRKFYNQISIFIFPSHYEGWGLPGMEALACGAALVASDSVGLRDYARNGETAIVVPIHRPDMLAEAVEALLDDDALRQRLARQGYERVRQYDWNRAVDALESLICSA